MKLRKYKKFSELSREVPLHREISFIQPWGDRPTGRKLKFIGLDEEDIEDAKIIEPDENEDDKVEEEEDYENIEQ